MSFEPACLSQLVFCMKLHLCIPKLSGLEDKATFAAAINKEFPPATEVSYTSDISTCGGKALRPYHLGYDANLGNAGMSIREEEETLITLITNLGFRTDPDQFPDATKLTVCSPTPAFHSNGLPGISVDALHTTSTLPAFGTAYVKGWRRSCALLFIIDVLIRKQLVEVFHAHNPTAFASYCTVHAMVVNFSSDIDKITAARGSQTCHCATHGHTYLC